MERRGIDEIDCLLADNAKKISELEISEEELRPEAEKWLSFQPDPRDYASACEFIRLGHAGVKHSNIQSRIVESYQERYDLVKRRHPSFFPRRYPTMKTKKMVSCVIILAILSIATMTRILYDHAKDDVEATSSTVATTVECVMRVAAVIAAAVAFVFHAV